MQPAGKAELRRRFAAARSARPVEELAAARAAICHHVLARARSAGWTTVAAYVPVRTEPGSTELLAALRAAGVRVLVPVVLPDRDLDWVRWDERHPADPTAAVDAPALGVSAVATAEAVLVPALAVSAGGVRLGRGGGSYDRALARVSGGLVAAILFDGELVAELPADDWDRPVAAVVTPSGWTELPGNAVIGQDG